MKPTALKGFVKDWLAMRGLEAETLDGDVLRLALPKELRERIGREELILAFSQRGLGKHPRAEMATVGNPVFDRLLGVAREEGRIGVGFTPPLSPAARPPSPEAAGTVAGFAAGKGEKTYQAILHFVFTITYPSIEAADEMEVVSIDSGSMEVLTQTPDLVELWNSMDPAPRKGRDVLSPFPLSERFREVTIRALERRMRRRSNKVRQLSAQQLEQETASIEAYYQQLIEEARNSSRRWTTRAEDREDRIHWLQLEWKRRIEEAAEFWRPRVNARLVAVGMQMVPRVAYRYGPQGKRGRGKGMAQAWIRLWDEATRAWIPTLCDGCGEEDPKAPEIGADGRLLCANCAKSKESGKNAAEVDRRGSSR